VQKVNPDLIIGKLWEENKIIELGLNKYFGWVPDSAAKFVTRAPANTTVLGIDELTALAIGIDSDNWQVYGLGHVHLLKGDPLGKFSAGHRFLGGSLS
jgi:hypothetical protein